MLEKREKLVMRYLNEVCIGRKSYLISATSIAENICRKQLISVAELDDIMITLSKENYIDFVAIDGKKGYFYCVSLKTKGLTFLKDQKKAKKETIFMLLKTLGLAVLSFSIGFLLRIIFKG